MAVMMTGAGRIPNVVNFVEYLQSSGTQYIDTEYTATSNNLKVKVKFEYTSVAQDQSVFGSQDSAGNEISGVPYMSPAGTASLYVGSSKRLFPLNVTAETVNEWSISVSEGTVTWVRNGDTQSASYSGAPTKSYPYFLFANNKAGSAVQFASVKIDQFELYDNGVQVRDMWPCYDPEGVACMYDKVEKKYHYNKGTGNFIAGGAA